jgi:hypothetical protein
MGYKRLALLILLGLLSTVSACDDEPPRALPDACDRVGHPDFTGPGYAVIGPQGGVIEETDPTSPLAGVNVAVYYGSEGILEVIERYRDSDYITCPPEAAAEPVLMPPG